MTWERDAADVKRTNAVTGLISVLTLLAILATVAAFLAAIPLLITLWRWAP